MEFTRLINQQRLEANPPLRGQYVFSRLKRAKTKPRKALLQNRNDQLLQSGLGGLALLSQNSKALSQSDLQREEEQALARAEMFNSIRLMTRLQQQEAVRQVQREAQLLGQQFERMARQREKERELRRIKDMKRRMSQCIRERKLQSLSLNRIRTRQVQLDLELGRRLASLFRRREGGE